MKCFAGGCEVRCAAVDLLQLPGDWATYRLHIQHGGKTWVMVGPLCKNCAEDIKGRPLMAPDRSEG